MSRRFSVSTLGCKVNQIDSAAMESTLESAGFVRVPFGDPADLLVVNTCAVTARADRQGRQLVARARAASPAGVVVVTGCSPKTSQAPAAYPEADIVCGNLEKDRILALLEEFSHAHRRLECIGPIADADRVDSALRAPVADRSRAFLKIQDGCSFACTYCIVPKARGSSRSLPPKQVLAGYAALVDHGFGEIVLSGIHLGAWGRDLSPGQRLSDLVDRLSASHPHVRLRLSSIEPREVDDALLERMARRENICSHLHIPMQSADNDVLAAMNRNYTAEDYGRLLSRIIKTVPDATVGADVIVGFPGESDVQFKRTCRFIEQSPLAHLHVFPFSARPGTPAADLSDRVAGDVIKLRAACLRELDRTKRRAHWERFVGRTLDVLCEGKKAGDFYGGLSDNYLPVFFLQPTAAGKRVTVAIERLAGPEQPAGLIGSILSDS